MTSASDTQVGGDHYKQLGEFQPWDVLRHWLTPEEYRGYQKGVAIAYLARERSKGGDEDMAKAVHHLQKLLEVVEEYKAAGTPIHGPAEVAPCCGHPNTCENPCFHRIQWKDVNHDGWMNWEGGPCPVSAGTMVQVRLRNGVFYQGPALSGPPLARSNWHWHFDTRLGPIPHLDPSPHPGDIVAYRIINPTT